MAGRSSRVTETPTRFQDGRCGKLHLRSNVNEFVRNISTWTACLEQDKLIVVFFSLISEKNLSRISVDLYLTKFVEDAALV